MRRHKQNRRIFRSANAIVELAIVFPVMIYMAMGVAEFGQFFYVKSAFESAARDATRFSILANAVKADPATAATNTLAQSNIAFNSSWMTITDDSNGTTITDVSQIFAGDAITITIKATYSQLPNAYRPLFLMSGKGISSGKLVVGQCTAIKE